MKKILVGLAVIVVFVLYSFWVRHEQPTTNVTALSTTPTTANTNTSSGTDSTTNSASTSNNSDITNQATSITYKDGTYTGGSYDASYGNVQVAAIISSGKLTSINILDYPNSHGDSIQINQQALPLLKEEAIQSQDPNSVQIISGATFTSEAFIQSLTSALNQAKA